MLFLLAGCERTENLSQEVLLNTGETILVHWTVDYEFSLQADSGSLGMHPKLVKTLDFDYAGKPYRYRGNALGVFLLAISPDRRPTLVLYSKGPVWDSSNNRQCTTYYAQLTPDDSGENWSFPPSIEPWLYGLRGNLSQKIFNLPPSPRPRDAMQTIKEEYSSKRKDDKWLVTVDETYTTRNCFE
jgi:hypothetical protein